MIESGASSISSGRSDALRVPNTMPFEFERLPDGIELNGRSGPSGARWPGGRRGRRAQSVRESVGSRGDRSDEAVMSPPTVTRLAAMITMKTKYALKALSRLASSKPGEPMLIADIAEQESIPRKFLELILVELKQHGILSSRKGRGGGYLLAKTPDTISVAAVMRVLDGPIAPVPCLSRTAYQRCAECRNEATCGVRLVFREAHEASVHVLENTTLADMIGRVELASRAGLPILKYSI